MSMQLAKISAIQKRIIVLTASIVAAFLLFVLFIYLPARNTVKKIQAELSVAESQINDIETTIQGAKTLEEGIGLLERRYKELKARFISKEEVSLKMLAEIAKKANVDIVSIKPAPRKPLLDEFDKQVSIDGKPVQVIYVCVYMRCFFKDLLKYGEILKNELPGFLLVEKLNIARNHLDRTRPLEVTLEFNLYVISD